MNLFGVQPVAFEGVYEVVFNRTVSACSAQATLAFAPGEILAEESPTNPNTIVVETFDSTGAPEAGEFSVAVRC